ncbi:MAG: tripartite tricarboxylate transporter substrate binding protein [Candidimonas sp.]|nr:MAG: tripartite tricarboxylate transporter substrate binding protein [Candidimonas sp.]TAM22659.1 MAG: tripartite tricarboxylate transporter substrate binding protein [Candidimonas sp.]TAM74468.1 MAG: tripartite tricarboxylate transporter substrate binding protein [Candidimonas sp.]
MSFRSASFAFLFMALTVTSTAHAAYPDRPVKLLVGYAPGGSTDIVARLLAKELGSKWRQTVVVENKPGASGMIAAEQVVRSAPDGYTLLLGYTPEVSINKLVFKNMHYDPIKDLSALDLVASAPLVLVSGPKLGIKNLAELLAHKGSKEPITYGSPGVGGQQHMAGAMLARLTDIPMTHVPYRGTSLAVSDLLGGQIDLFFATTPPLLQHIRAGKLHAILVASSKREKLLPDVPTAVELGLPRLQLTNWFGVFGPRNLPVAVADKISADVIAVLGNQGFIKSLEVQGLNPTPLQGRAFTDFISSEMKKYEQIVTETGISAK